MHMDNGIPNRVLNKFCANTHIDNGLLTIVHVVSRFYKLVRPFGSLATFVTLLGQLNTVFQAVKSTAECTLVTGVVTIGISFHFS